MEVESMLPINHSQEEISPVNPGDYKDEDGLLVCGVCGRRKQFQIRFGTFEKIVPCICKCREDEIRKEKERDAYEQRMHTINRLKESSMMSGKYRDAVFSRYTIRKENQKAHKIAMNYVERFPEMKENNQGLLFYGPVGTGKSYTAACIANALMEKNVPVIMTSFVKILQDVKGMTNEASYIQILNSASLLIIDDLGTERDTDYSLEKVYNIIDSRVQSNKPMILTTNLDLSEILDCQDIRYKKVYDRIIKTCFPVEILGESFRKQEAAERFERMQQLLA